ncbi:MAG: hypothetical protein GC202_11600 [Alphaproteobacteria bacterium]|nr:hypothetical protein [Alphaproteobacteria bacterium]
MIAALIVAILAFSAGPAAAMPDPIPSGAVDPARIRFVTSTKASSTCIGRPNTPMCGIETLIGCYEQVRNAGCVQHRDPRLKGKGLPIRVEYVVVKAGFVNRKRVRAALATDYGRENWRWLTADEFQVRVFVRQCPDSLASCDGIDWDDAIYAVGPSVYKTGPSRGLWTFAMFGMFSPEDFFVD